MEKVNAGPSIEDGDGLVVAVLTLGDKVKVNRRPGILSFYLMTHDGLGLLIVVRSRFDGVYGNICRMTLVDQDETKKTTYAPTRDVVNAVLDRNPVEALENLFCEWLNRGKENGK